MRRILLPCSAYRRQPVQLANEKRCFITAQNHGYVVEGSTLPEEWREWFINMNDNTNEGIRHNQKPWMAVQFIPEMNCGPIDTEFVFNQFFELLNK